LQSLSANIIEEFLLNPKFTDEKKDLSGEKNGLEKQRTHREERRSGRKNYVPEERQK
jgi:hypothetical protein